VVQGEAFALSYDYLALGLGSRSHFFGVAGAQQHALPLKALEQAVVERNQTRASSAQRRNVMLLVGAEP
jgi:NADH dehydrogenase